MKAVVLSAVVVALSFSPTLFAKGKTGHPAGYPKIFSGGGAKAVGHSTFKWENPSDELIAKAMHQLTAKPLFVIYNERVTNHQDWGSICEKFNVTYENLEETFKNFQKTFREEVKEKEKKFDEASSTLKQDRKAWKKNRKKA
ncbi:MAG: hypothetical protein HYS22_06585 [Deltaproteobacteria bacterium]|nr:hypothetical protein [Deltaproteobacteria bacterium]